MPPSNEASKDETVEGRIAAVAHLSAALALIDCAWDAITDEDVEPDSPEEQRWSRKIAWAREAMTEAADTLMEPCEIANVLQTVEETIEARGPAPVDHALRAHIVAALIDVRQAAKDDEREPTDDQLANRHGMEGGIGYRTEPSMEDLLREKGDL